MLSESCMPACCKSAKRVIARAIQAILVCFIGFPSDDDELLNRSFFLSSAYELSFDRRRVARGVRRGPVEGRYLPGTGPVSGTHFRSVSFSRQ